MLFNSLQFLVFLPVVLIVYYVIPDKIKYIWLLLSSYYFYMCWNAQYALLIGFSTIITYLCALAIDNIRQNDELDEKKRLKYQKGCVISSLILNVGILFFFKYSNFMILNVNTVLSHLHIQYHQPYFDIILPVGISFYTFQALGYTIDVYRGDIYAEKNLFRYALFVSFFPQLVAGPIERSGNLLKQLAVPAKASFDNLRDGLLLMLWGFFLKIVLADRIAIVVDGVYNNPDMLYGGYYILVATILFGIQIYCDFSGYSVIAMGAAKMLGIELMENFTAPYLAKSTGEFWHRWHISLSSWFKDYLYIPLGGNRKGRRRKYWNLLITFGVSGFWHGASWGYFVWGILNGIYQIMGDIIKPVRKWLIRVLGLNADSIGHKMIRIAMTFIFIDFSWIFFRAQSLHTALVMIRNMFTVHNPWILFDGSLYQLGLDEKNFKLMIYGIVILLGADICKYRKIRIREVIEKQDYWCQAVIIAFAAVAILLLGIWGSEYDVSNFIYFQF